MTDWEEERASLLNDLDRYHKQALMDPRFTIRVDTAFGMGDRMDEKSRGSLTKLRDDVVRAFGYQPSGGKTKKEKKPMPNYVSRIKSNLKAGCDLELGPKTLIYGVNGSGKSSAVGAIEFALTCRVSDVAGKSSIALPADLVALAPGRQGYLWATAELDTGEEATAEMEIKAAGSGTRPKHQAPTLVTANVHPIRDLEEAFKSSDKAQSFLLRNGGGLVTRQDVLERIPDRHQTRYRGISKQNARDPIANLMFVMQHAKDKARVNKASAKAAENAVELASVDLPAPATAAQIDAQRSKAAHARAGHTQRLDEWTRKQAADVAREGIEELKTAIAKARAYDISRFERGKAMLGLYEVAAERKLATCPFCKTAADPECWGDKHNALKPAVEALAPSDEYKALAGLERQLAGKQAIIARAPTREASAAFVSTAKALLDVAVAEHEKMLRTKAQWDAHKSTMNAGEDLAEDAEQWSKLADACKKARHALVATAAKAFSEKVSSYLPAADTFVLRLREGKRDVVQYGLMREGTLHTALSGAEWARVTAALASVLSSDAPLAVIMPEERAFDAKTLRAVMVALTNAPQQVILTSPIKHGGRAPAGWTIINLDKLKKNPEHVAAVEAIVNTTSEERTSELVEAEPALAPAPTPEERVREAIEAMSVDDVAPVEVETPPVVATPTPPRSSGSPLL